MNIDDRYGDLANAIVLQAVKDYRHVLRVLKKKPRNTWALDQKNKTERFFRSQWFAILTAIDPEWLIEKLNSENFDDDQRQSE